MSYLIDTSILGRLSNSADAQYPVAAGALAELHRLGEPVFLTPQNLIEFRNFGRAPKLLPDTPDIFPAWKLIVQATAAIGKQVHDARLVAVCHVHRVTHLLIFNTAHFVRLAGVAPGIVVVDPATV